MTESTIMTITKLREYAQRLRTEHTSVVAQIQDEEKYLADKCAAMRCEDCYRKGYEPHSTRVCEFFGKKSDRLYELYAGEEYNDPKRP